MIKNEASSAAYRYFKFLGLLCILFFSTATCARRNEETKTNPEIASRIDQGYKLMASRGAWQRALAETLLRSAWEKRSSVSASERSTLALRLVHLLERNADPKGAWKVLQEARAEGLIDFCRSAGILDSFRCAEAERLAGTLQYAFHSWPESETERESPPCEGLARKRDPRRSVSECLSLARESLQKSNSVWDRLDSEMRELIRAFDAKPNGFKEAVDLRREFTRLNLGLVLQESGEFDRLPQIFGVNPNDCPEKPRSLYGCLHLARAKRDQGDLEGAKRLLTGVLKATDPPELAWRARLVNATLELRQGHIADVREILADVLTHREGDQQVILKRGNPFFLDRRLTTTENAEDVLISAMLESAEAPGPDTSLQRYLSAIFGTGEAFLAKQFAEWHGKGAEVSESLAATVASDISQWTGGALAGERRRAAFEKLGRRGAELGEPIEFSLGSHEEIWRKAWKKMGDSAELLAILQYRKFDYRKDITEAIGDMEYVALYFHSQASKPIVRTIGKSFEWNEKIRSIRQGGPDGPAVELSKRIGITKAPTERLVILAAGSFQQFPWGLLVDEDGGSLAKRKTAMILANSLIEVAGWGESSAIPARSSLLFANPDLRPLLAVVRQTKSLQALEGRLVWTADDERNAAQESTAFRSLFADSQELVANNATESELKNMQNPFALHIRTHGAYLEDQTQVPASDRSLMLFSLGATDDGLFLSSEARMLRLGGTRLVTLSVCEAGEGRGRRSGLIEGFRRSFHLAGARSVLAPLWIVDSTKAAQFITDFLTAAKSAPLDEALNAAQQKASVRAGWQSQDWAGWVLSGDPSPLVNAPGRGQR